MVRKSTIIIAIIMIMAFILLLRKQPIESIRAGFKWGKQEFFTAVKYQESREKNGEEYNYTASFVSPVGTKVHINTLSDDSVAVTDIRQEGKQTVVVIEPIDSN